MRSASTARNRSAAGGRRGGGSCPYTHPCPPGFPGSPRGVGDSHRGCGPKEGETVLRGVNEGKICPVSCLQSHGSCFCYMSLTLLAFISLKSVAGFNSRIRLFYEITGRGGKHCNTKSFILQSKKSICSYIQYHIPPFKYICYVYKRKDSTEIIYRNKMRRELFKYDSHERQPTASLRQE